MESVSTCDYSSFLEKGGKNKQKKASLLSFSSLKKNVCKILKNRRLSAYAAISIALLCFLTVTFFFIYIHTNIFFSSSSEGINNIYPYRPFPYINRIVDKQQDEENTNIWRWEESKFEEEFNIFTNKFKKTYANENEKQKRYAIFKKNLYFIHTHNEQVRGSASSSSSSSSPSYELRMNAFGDLTNEEFKTQFVGYKKQKVDTFKASSLGFATDLLDMSEGELPSVVDWKQHCVTHVKNQQQCGSCWAFSAVGALEGAICAKTGKLYNLSEQQLIDCAKCEGNEGCSGGEMDLAFEYVMHNKGLCSEQDYPYTAKDNSCHAKSCNNAIQIQGFKDVPRGSELAMRVALHKYGPVSVAVEADKLAFQFYHKGVFSAECGSNLNHGVLLVGYKKTKKNEKVKNNNEINERENDKNKTTNNHREEEEEDVSDYFEIKNSWGTGWGENGFMRLAMHKGSKGECGILMDASFPVV